MIYYLKGWSVICYSYTGNAAFLLPKCPIAIKDWLQYKTGNTISKEKCSCIWIEYWHRGKISLLCKRIVVVKRFITLIRDFIEHCEAYLVKIIYYSWRIYLFLPFPFIFKSKSLVKFLINLMETPVNKVLNCVKSINQGPT